MRVEKQTRNYKIERTIMDEFKDLTINESSYRLKDENKYATIAVFIYTGSADPKEVLDQAISIYTEKNSYHEFIDANLDNPWTRVIMSDVNNMPQRKFKPETDRMLK